MRDAVTICDPSELAFAHGRDGPLTLCCGEISSFNASAIMAVQNERNAGKPWGRTGEAGVATLRALAQHGRS